MNNILRTTKYLFNDFKKALVIYYGIILSISAFMIYIYFTFRNQSSGDMSFGGFDNASLIFMFVLGLNAFKPNFKFLQANNVSRKRFYFASIISFAALSVVMSVIDQLIMNILWSIIPYETVYQGVYHGKAILQGFVFSTALLAFAGCAGWCISMLYYKCNNLMKVFVSLSPVILMILAYRIDVVVNGAFGRWLQEFFLTILGVKSGNPNIASLTFTVLFAIASGLSFLLLRRMTIKD